MVYHLCEYTGHSYGRSSVLINAGTFLPRISQGFITGQKIAELPCMRQQTPGGPIDRRGVNFPFEASNRKIKRRFRVKIRYRFSFKSIVIFLVFFFYISVLPKKKSKYFFFKKKKRKLKRFSSSLFYEEQQPTQTMFCPTRVHKEDTKRGGGSTYLKQKTGFSPLILFQSLFRR